MIGSAWSLLQGPVLPYLSGLLTRVAEILPLQITMKQEGAFHLMEDGGHTLKVKGCEA